MRVFHCQLTYGKQQFTRLKHMQGPSGGVCDGFHASKALCDLWQSVLRSALTLTLIDLSTHPQLLVGHDYKSTTFNHAM
jgi:hypothetical protein